MNLQFGLKGQNRHYRKRHYLIRGACFSKKKARSPSLKGFGLDFSAVLKFTGQQHFHNSPAPSSPPHTDATLSPEKQQISHLQQKNKLKNTTKPWNCSLFYLYLQYSSTSIQQILKVSFNELTPTQLPGAVKQHLSEGSFTTPYQSKIPKQYLEASDFIIHRGLELSKSKSTLPTSRLQTR